jgi:hypothetical protein
MTGRAEIRTFDLPDEPPRIVHVGPHEIEVRAVVYTARVGEAIGEGCVNDTFEDRVTWCAEYRGRREYGDTPEEAARAVLIA